MFGKKKIAMMLAEFVGTGALTMVVLTVAKSQVGLPYFVSLAAGLVVALMVLAVGSASGAHLNPALTIGLWSARKIKTLPAVVYIVMQLLGGFGAYLLYSYLVKAHWANTGHFTLRVMVAEAVGAFVFAFGWMAAARQKYELGRFAAAAGLAVATGMIVASAASNGFINPAVALGVRTWGWGTYVLGPVVGAIVGVNLYDIVFADPFKGASAATATNRGAVKSVKPVAKKKPAAKKKK